MMFLLDIIYQIVDIFQTPIGKCHTLLHSIFYSEQRIVTPQILDSQEAKIEQDLGIGSIRLLTTLDTSALLVRVESHFDFHFLSKEMSSFR